MPIKFGLNHMTAPRLPVGDFFKLAATLGIRDVEIRNDIAGNAILDGTSPEKIRELAAVAGVDIITINALQRFNEWNAARAKEADELAAYAGACGAKALILVPVNDGSGKGDGERQQNLRTALTALKPILAAHGVTGLVEPLGFEICSLRSKREAVEGIDAVGGADRFKVVHDTFHHVLGGEPEIFPERTGLVHISGVSDTEVTVARMLDAHRVLVDAADRLDNVGQIRRLDAAGYRGPFSFEPFAESVANDPDHALRVRESMEHIVRSL